jgi:geranylgeranyl diphosphate synthase type I
VLAQHEGSFSVGTALRVVRFKAAKYTVERPLQFGATLGGADPTTLAALSAVGLPLGEAFQLRDDVLGVFGDPAVTGKPSGDDLREGKRTVLVTLAHDATDDAGRAQLAAGLGNPQLSADGVAQLREIVVASGALTEVERMIAERAGTAEAALNEAIIRPDARAALRALSAQAITRTR